MTGNGKVKLFSTIKKDEAAFHLSELARGLLRNRISIRVGERNLVMATFDSIRLEMKASDKNERHTVEIQLSWPKAPSALTAGIGDGHPVTRDGQERS